MTTRNRTIIISDEIEISCPSGERRGVNHVQRRGGPVGQIPLFTGKIKECQQFIRKMLAAKGKIPPEVAFMLR